MFADTPDGAVDRSGAPCGNFLEEFTGGGRRCESLSPRCPQISYTPPGGPGRIVDAAPMTASRAGTVLATRRLASVAMRGG